MILNFFDEKWWQKSLDNCISIISRFRIINFDVQIIGFESGQKTRQISWKTFKMTQFRGWRRCKRHVILLFFLAKTTCHFIQRTGYRLRENDMSFCIFCAKRHVVYSEMCVSRLTKMTCHFLRIEKRHVVLTI